MLFYLKVKLKFCRYILCQLHVKTSVANCACLCVCVCEIPTYEFSSDVAGFHHTVTVEIFVHPSDIFSFFM